MNTTVDRRSLLASGSLALATAALPGFARAAGRAVGQPWQLLFNGADLTGWSFFQQGVGEVDTLGAVAVEDGMLHVLGSDYQPKAGAGFGHIATTRAYGNYHLRLDYRWGNRRLAPRALAKRNSGVLYHMADTRQVLYPDCVEFQIEETDVGDAILVNVTGIEGPSLGGTPAWPNFPPTFSRTYVEPQVAGGIARQWFRRTGDMEQREGWNTLDLIAFDDQVAHLVNGRIVTTAYGLRKRALPGRVPESLTSGRIALELEGAEIFFRNIMLRALTPFDIAAMKGG